MPSNGSIFIADQAALDISDGEFAAIRQILQDVRGFSLDAYKDKCVRRRIGIRIRANHCESAQEYCDLLASHPMEVDLLLKVLTIHVSQFFRNFTSFEKLRTEVIPFLFSFARQEGLERLRFWSVGCAGGEEPYTLALLLADHFEREMTQVPVEIVGTDVDASILESARLGLYSPERLIELPLYYRQKYFSEENGRFLLDPAIRQMVTFRHGDMFRDDCYAPSDLVLCRNVMIYFARDQQERVFRNFARVLNPWGFLVLGKSETILGGSRSLFQTVCPIERIYRPVPAERLQALAPA
jgi:chemotaxis protein methyltransferase CheR